MRHQTKIICTLGPASNRREIIAKMAKAGMNVARLNFSHGSHLQHQKTIDTLRKVNEKCNYDIKILQDLQGYRIRIGILKHPIKLEDGQFIWMSKDPEHTENHIPLVFDGDIKSICTGTDIFINDGMLFLKVVKRVGRRIKLQVIHGGHLSSKKNVNIPGIKLKANILTCKDKDDIAFGVRNKVDYIAQSFVRNKRDIGNVASIVRVKNPKCKIIAKIENQQGVRNIDSIISACDGIMIARGDLGVSLPIYKIPLIQKDIIRRCNRNKKFVITATQMLESMTERMRPTRAEVSDVANAILDGTDFVMLSGETAVGRFPANAVRMMCQIVDYTQKNK